MSKKIDPFAHVVDSSHVEFLFGFELQGLEIHPFGPDGPAIPLKFIIFITVCAIFVAMTMIWLGRKMENGEPPRGKLWNLLESLLFFVRDKIAIPGIGEHDYRKYLPYLASLFLFIFSMNLLGMIPFLGSPTASLAVTGALALVSFVIIHASGLMELGGEKYLKTFIPHIHIEGGAGDAVPRQDDHGRHRGTRIRDRVHPRDRARRSSFREHARRAHRAVHDPVLHRARVGHATGRLPN